MTQEDKELLLKDLCARLSYETMFYSNSNGDECLLSIDLEYCKINELYTIEQIKPYLRPMSSMTEEELHELAYKVLQQPDLDLVKNTETLDIRFSDLDTLTTWLNSHHFDYRGLIEKGLALEAPEGMYSIKEK